MKMHILVSISLLLSVFTAHTMDAPQKHYALLSVYDKTGIISFAQFLRDRGYTILSTGGTACLLQEAGVPVTLVADLTGSPEILNGRVKTLHPKIHGALLAKRDNEEHNRECVEHMVFLLLIS